MNELAQTTQTPLALTAGFAVLLIINLLLKFWLTARQVRHVAKHRAEVPAAFSAQISLESHQKAADYTMAHARLGMLEVAWGGITLLGWTLLGGLDALNRTIGLWLVPGIKQEILLIVAFTAISSALDLPFSLYRTFVLEERFGFNKMTLDLWFKDLVKSSLIGAVIGIPILALVLWLMGAMGSQWWLWTWVVWMGLNLLLMLIYPTWIAPLFNKFKPLDNPELVAHVTQLMQRCGFQSKGLFVMDGSQRSAHANAYFTGFGASKRVVFYDTLLSQLTAAEVDAVLAHELGHFHHKHIVKRIVSMFAFSLIGFLVLGWLSNAPWFYTGLGVIPNIYGPNNGLALLLFMMATPLISTFAGPVLAHFSRKHEFEADAFSALHTHKMDLSSALLKLYKDNASTLTPDPIYVRFYYSHPPASERLAHLQQLTH